MNKEKIARIPLIPPTEWSEDAREAFAVLNSSATKALGAASNMAMTFAHHPKLAKAYYTLGKYLALESQVPAQVRELATLRVAWLAKSEYEWFHHVTTAKRIGLSDEKIEAVKQDPRAYPWSDADACVLNVVDELYWQHKVSDETWGRLNSLMSLQQVMDLVFTIGHYIATAMALHAFNIDIEAGFDSQEHPLETN